MISSPLRGSDRGAYSPLSNIYGEWIIRKATQKWRGVVSIGGRRICNLLYADDTTLLAQSDEEMAMLLQLIEQYSTEAGLKLNKNKCSIMVVDKAGTLPESFRMIPKGRKESFTWGHALQIEGVVKKKLRDASEWQNQQSPNVKNHHIKVVIDIDEIASVSGCHIRIGVMDSQSSSQCILSTKN